MRVISFLISLKPPFVANCSRCASCALLITLATSSACSIPSLPGDPLWRHMCQKSNLSYTFFYRIKQNSFVFEKYFFTPYQNKQAKIEKSYVILILKGTSGNLRGFFGTTCVPVLARQSKRSRSGVQASASRKKFWFGAYNLLTSVCSAVVVLSKALYEFLSYQQQNMLRWIQHQGVIGTPLRLSRSFSLMTFKSLDLIVPNNLLKVHVSFLVFDWKPEKVIIIPDFCQLPYRVF